jgi:hypothetical protein
MEIEQICYKTNNNNFSYRNLNSKEILVELKLDFIHPEE